jgi:hypothetical protein
MEMDVKLVEGYPTWLTVTIIDGISGCKFPLIVCAGSYSITVLVLDEDHIIS